MSNHPETDRSMVVPPAAPLTGEPLDPSQPSPSEVLPGGDALELDHLEPLKEQDG